MFPPRDISNVLMKNLNIKPIRMCFRKKKDIIEVDVYTNDYSKGKIKLMMKGKIFNVNLVSRINNNI